MAMRSGNSSRKTQRQQTSKRVLIFLLAIGLLFNNARPLARRGGFPKAAPLFGGLEEGAADVTACCLSSLQFTSLRTMETLG